MNPTRAHLFPQDTHKIKKFEKNEKTLFKSGFIFQNHGFLWDSGNIVIEKNTKYLTQTRGECLSFLHYTKGLFF